VKPNGLLLVISGPSGAGKGTICAGLREKLPELAYSVSVTTREPRAGEVDGKDYFFKTVPEVKKMIFEGQLLEHADVYGHIYGTPKPYVMDLLGQGKDVLLGN
jgi:guanylate kinase